MSTPLEILKAKFGYHEFRPGQQAVMDHLLNGHSAAAIFPTGSGKSLCYQIPSLLLPGLTLVVSPLIALMKDQIDALHQRGIAAERLDSTLDAEQVTGVMNRVRAGSLKMLYVAPERFNNERFRAAMQRVPVSLFAVDEAHCISEWGHNFRPDYLKLARYARQFRAERLLALTATATPQVLADICRGFEIQPQCAVRTGFYRPNLLLIATPISKNNRDAALLERLQTRPPGPTIVYVTLQKTAEQVADLLARAGLDARPYHAGMEDEERARVQDWFLASARAVVVATIAFGMGIDKSNIRYIDHYNLPKSLENYSQEIGRSGRDGLPATCEMYVCPADLNVLENFIYGDTPSLESVQSLLRDIFRREDDFDVSLYDLSFQHDIRQIVLKTLLTYLELEGLIEEGTPYYSKYQFKLLTSAANILSRFDDDRRQFLETLFRTASPGKTWSTVDLESAAAQTSSPRERIVRALDYLAEHKLIELKAEGVRSRFKILQRPPDATKLAETLHSRTIQREEQEIARLHLVLDLAGHGGCLAARLGEHFGERIERPCGHCSWCRDHSPAALLPRAAEVIDDAIRKQVPGLRRENHELFAEPRSLARFLCGISSPKVSRARLASHPLFGSLSHVPFAEVLRRAQGQKG
jgi:ATP-dependent DNA helicase RecQ